MPVFRIVGMACYALLALLILIFIFSNREPMVVEFFPLGNSGELPLYIILCVMFVAGLLLGLLHSASVWAGMRSKLRRSERAVSQLEKELAARPVVVSK